MIALKTLIRRLNDELSVSLFQDYCPNGLQVEGKEEIRKVGGAVTASLNVIEQAVHEGCDALIVHHGLFWKGDPYPVVGTKKEKLKKLLNHEISLLAYHLPLDAHQKLGNNWKAALELGWSSLEPFGELNGNFIGVKGVVEKQNQENFKKKLEEYYVHPAMCALGGKKEVETCALISGGAYKEIPAVAREGIDCYVTGNFDEPAWHLAHEEKVNFFALGHAATEKVGPKALLEWIQKTFHVEVLFLDENNPF